MRHPRRVRNIALCFVAYGIVATPLAFLMPDGTVETGWYTALFIFGLLSLIFGGFFALTQHSEARHQERLMRGEGIIAQWWVDPLSWRDFVRLNRQANAERGALRNQLTVVEEAPPEGIEIIVADGGVQVGGDFQYLPFRGTPRIESIHRLRNDRAACIELSLYYPSAKYLATRLALRIPVPAGAEAEANKAMAHYQASKLATRPPPGIALRKPRLFRMISLILLLLCAASFAGGLLLEGRQALGDLPRLLTVAGAVTGIGAAIILLVAQIKLSLDPRRES